MLICACCWAEVCLVCLVGGSLSAAVNARAKVLCLGQGFVFALLHVCVVGDTACM